ncbi:hypothetical protein V3470_13555 [Flavobacterium oreochromis]|nr:hypothetical protein BWG23_11110 [Flavobacterium oreochromis]
MEVSRRCRITGSLSVQRIRTAALLRAIALLAFYLDCFNKLLKKCLKISLMNSLNYQIFGSQDSQDVDVVFFIDKMPETIQEKLNLSKEYSAILQPEFPTKNINPNLAVLENGIVKHVYKGTVDELNNALYYTYGLHNQKFDNQIVKSLPRDIDLKFLRSSRMILSFLSKTKYRIPIKVALRNNLQHKVQVLKEIDLATLANFGKSKNEIAILKSIAFQIGQSMALHNGKECYTKSQIADCFPELRSYLAREINSDLSNLQFWLIKYVEILEIRATKMNFLEEYEYINTYVK